MKWGRGIRKEERTIKSEKDKKNRKKRRRSWEILLFLDIYIDSLI